jgi:hypothetical protein
MAGAERRRQQEKEDISMETELDISSARIFYDGLLTEPRLDHPEGLAVLRDGSVCVGASVARFTA